MKRRLLLGLFVANTTAIFSQEADSIKISMPGALHTIKECVLTINLTRKDKETFLFPKKYYIGDDTENADLMILLQKKDSVTNAYENYSCNESPIRLRYLKVIR
jgi:hypothetical protein